MIFKKRNLVIIVLILLCSCSLIGNGKSIDSMTPKEKALWMFTVYNAEYADYMTTTGYIWDDVEKEWKKQKSPVLTEDQKKILRSKKEALSAVYPLIKIYDSAVNKGDNPDGEVEKQIIDLLTNIQKL